MDRLSRRTRIAPTWRAGLRRGRERNSTMLLLQRSPNSKRAFAGRRKISCAGVSSPRGSTSSSRSTMTAARRRAAGTGASLTVPAENREAMVHRDFRRDLSWWIGSNPRTALRVMRLVEEAIRNPFVGTGKPEALKHRVEGEWSRRITDADRLVYLVRGAMIYFLAARSHYGQH